MTANEIITAVYRADYKQVSITYMMDGAHQFTAVGEVSEEEIGVLVDAGGSSVTGWSVELA